MNTPFFLSTPKSLPSLWNFRPWGCPPVLNSSLHLPSGMTFETALNVHDPEVPRLIEGGAFEEFSTFDEYLDFASATQLLQGFCGGLAVQRCAERHDDHDNRAECGHFLIPKTIHFKSSHAYPPPAVFQQRE